MFKAPPGWKFWRLLAASGALLINVQMTTLLLTFSVQKSILSVGNYVTENVESWKVLVNGPFPSVTNGSCCIVGAQDAHKNYTRTAKELNKTRSSYGELEGMVGKLRSSLENTASNQGKDRNRIQDLSEEVTSVWQS